MAANTHNVYFQPLFSELCVCLLWLFLGFCLLPMNVCTVSSSPTYLPQGLFTGPGWAPHRGIG